MENHQALPTRKRPIHPDFLPLILAVKDHAIENYDKGWDLIIETMEDTEILDIISAATTPKGAIRVMQNYLSPIISYRKDIENA